MEYQFGPFRLNTESFVLLRGDEPISITPKAFQILRVLVENSDRVVGRDELVTSVWADVSVEESNLTQNIFTIRKILGESRHDHRFIVTIPGKGYRFVASVKTSGPSSGGNGRPHGDTHADTSEGRNPPLRFTVRTALIAFQIVVVFSLAKLALDIQQNRLPQYAAVPLTSYPGSAVCPSFAPEGERVAFSWDGENEDNFDIYVKQIGPGVLSRATTDPRPDLSPAWSPDGSTIAFLRLITPEMADLVLTPSHTHGPERRIAEITGYDQLNSRVRSLSWSPDGKWIVAADKSCTNGDVTGLCLISVPSGKKRPLTEPPGWNDDLDPSIAPDMKHMVFARYSGPVSDLYIVDFSNELHPLHEPKRLTFYERETGSPVWSRDGRFVLFTRYSSRGSPSIWRMPFPFSGRPEPVNISSDDARSLSLSPAGRRLVYARETRSAGLWGIEMPDLSSGEALSGTCKRWIASSRQEVTPEFSPDGQHVAF